MPMGSSWGRGLAKSPGPVRMVDGPVILSSRRVQERVHSRKLAPTNSAVTSPTAGSLPRGGILFGLGTLFSITAEVT
jgi:hypothetical protein